jgi:hypothetical protein
MHSLPLIPERKQKEWTLIKVIAQNNNYPKKPLQKLNFQIQHKPTNQAQINERNKNKTLTTFTYYSPIIRKISNLFKHTNVGISFKNTSTLQQLTKPKIVNNAQEKDKSRIYKLTCNTCKMSYIGQTSRSLKQRYQEHIRYIKHNELQSAYPLHILNNKHEYGPINNTKTLLKHINKTTLLIPFEQLYIQSYHHHRELIPEQHIGKHNPIYQLIHDLHNMSLPTRLTDQYSNINTTSLPLWSC